MIDQWIAMHYNSGKRTVIGVLNYIEDKPMIVHHTIDTQWHDPTGAPGAIDTGLIQYMDREGIDKFVHQTAGVEIDLETLKQVEPRETVILSGPFAGQRTSRVFAPLPIWKSSQVKWRKPNKMSDEISLDEGGNVLCTGIDTR